MLKPALKITLKEVTNRLEELFGLEAELFVNAIEKGYTESSFCTDNDSPMAAGFIRWNSTQRALREALLPYGWVRDNENNYCRVFSPCGKYAIAVMSGCSTTGNEETSSIPSNNCVKKTCTIEAVEINNQLLIPGLYPFLQADEQLSERKTWVLLSHVDKVNGKIRIELSLPNKTDGGFITSWDERIILPAYQFNTQALQKQPDFSEEINIEIQRKPVLK